MWPALFKARAKKISTKNRRRSEGKEKTSSITVTAVFSLERDLVRGLLLIPNTFTATGEEAGPLPVAFARVCSALLSRAPLLTTRPELRIRVIFAGIGLRPPLILAETARKMFAQKWAAGSASLLLLIAERVNRKGQLECQPFSEKYRLPPASGGAAAAAASALWISRKSGYQRLIALCLYRETAYAALSHPDPLLHGTVRRGRPQLNSLPRLLFRITVASGCPPSETVLAVLVSNDTGETAEKIKGIIAGSNAVKVGRLLEPAESTIFTREEKERCYLDLLALAALPFALTFTATEPLTLPAPLESTRTTLTNTLATTKNNLLEFATRYIPEAWQNRNFSEDPSLTFEVLLTAGPEKRSGLWLPLPAGQITPTDLNFLARRYRQHWWQEVELSIDTSIPLFVEAVRLRLSWSNNSYRLEKKG